MFALRAVRLLVLPIKTIHSAIGSSRPTPSDGRIAALRRAIVDAPVRLVLPRARVFSEVGPQREADPWIVRTATTLRRDFETLPLAIRPHDRIMMFEKFTHAVAADVRAQMHRTHANLLKVHEAQNRWGVTPLTTCFFDGYIARARDIAAGTTDYHLSCRGIAFANAVDSFTTIREVVVERRPAALDEIGEAVGAEQSRPPRC